MRVSRLVCLAITLGACTAEVDVDDYTFEPDPCGPRPTSCTGGRTIAFAVRSVQVPMEGTPGHRDGIDLDGTSDAICDQPDYVAVDGAAGVDNSFSLVLESFHDLLGFDIRSESEAAAAMGHTDIVILEHVDDLGHDDCIEVTHRPAVLPEGVTVDDLDLDHDGLLDADLTFDYLTSADHDPVACAIDHVVHARFPPSVTVFAVTSIEGTVSRGRLRMPIDEQGSHGAVIAGSFPVEDFVGGLPDAIVAYIQQHADLDPSSRAAHDCSSISYALNLDLVPCSAGHLRVLSP